MTKVQNRTALALALTILVTASVISGKVQARTELTFFPGAPFMIAATSDDGDPNDHDAIDLFDALAAKVETDPDSTSETKAIEFKTGSTVVFQIHCTKYLKAGDSSSCMTMVYNSPLSTIDDKNQTVTIYTSDLAPTVELSKLFRPSNADGFVYQSSDRKFIIELSFDSTGAPYIFKMTMDQNAVAPEPAPQPML